MPGLVSTLLNQAYSMPGRLVHTFLHVTEQVWQPMHLSRLSTMPIWRGLSCLLSFAIHPIHLPHLPHHHEFIAVGADRSVVVEAVAELRIAADHVGRLGDDARHRVVDAA